MRTHTRAKAEVRYSTLQNKKFASYALIVNTPTNIPEKVTAQTTYKSGSDYLVTQVSDTYQEFLRLI